MKAKTAENLARAAVDGMTLDGLQRHKEKLFAALRDAGAEYGFPQAVRDGYMLPIASESANGYTPKYPFLESNLKFALKQAAEREKELFAIGQSAAADGGRVAVTDGIMLIDTKLQSFDMQEIANRRFMYSPASGALILGYQYKDSKKIISSHAEEHGLSDTDEPYDSFIRGWVGTGGSYPDGVIHFTPPIPNDSPIFFGKGFSALEMFRENGAMAGTVVRAFPGAWEQPFSDLLDAAPERGDCRPWLYGIKPMTRDDAGFLYYKDKQVDRYTDDYACSLDAKRWLKETLNRCDYLERNGVEVSCDNAIWNWEKYQDAYGKEKQAELDRILGGCGFTFSKAVIDNNWNTEIEFYRPGVPYWDELKDGPEFMDLYDNHNREHGFEVSIQSYRYGGGLETENPEAMSLIPSCFDYLRANGLMQKVKSQNFMAYPEREREYEAETDGGMDDEMDEDDEMEEGL